MAAQLCAAALLAAAVAEAAAAEPEVATPPTRKLLFASIRREVPSRTSYSSSASRTATAVAWAHDPHSTNALDRCDALAGTSRPLILPFERASSGHCPAGRRMSREVCRQTAEAYGKEMRTATQSYEPYGCWLFEQTGNPNSGYVYWREPAGGNGPNCGGLRDCLCLTEVSCALRPNTAAFSSADEDLGHGSTAAQCVAKVARERPAAKAVKYDTTQGKCYSSSATTRPAPAFEQKFSGQCASGARMTREDCAAFAAAKGTTLSSSTTATAPYGCSTNNRIVDGRVVEGNEVYWKNLGSGSGPACSGTRPCACKNVYTSEVCALTKEYWRMDSSATGLTGSRPLCPAGSVMSREQCGRIAEQHGKKWGYFYLGEGYCVGGTSQASGYTVDTCATRCRQTSGCNGFSFQDDSTRQCLLSMNGCASRRTNNWPWKGYAITSIALNEHLLISTELYAPVGCFQMDYPGHFTHGLWAWRDPNAHRIESGVCSSVTYSGRAVMDRMSKAECAAFAATHSPTKTLSEYDGGPYGCWKHEESGSPNNGKVYWRDVGTGNGPNCDGLRPCYCKPKPSETPDCAAGIRRCACSTSCSASTSPVAKSGATSYAATQVMPVLNAAGTLTTMNNEINQKLGPGGANEIGHDRKLIPCKQANSDLEGRVRVASGHCKDARSPPLGRMTRAECAAFAATHSPTKTLSVSTESYAPYGCWKFEAPGSDNNGKVYWRDVGSGDGPDCGGQRPCTCMVKGCQKALNAALNERIVPDISHTPSGSVIGAVEGTTNDIVYGVANWLGLTDRTPAPVGRPNCVVGVKVSLRNIVIHDIVGRSSITRFDGFDAGKAGTSASPKYWGSMAAHWAISRLRVTADATVSPYYPSGQGCIKVGEGESASGTATLVLSTSGVTTSLEGDLAVNDANKCLGISLTRLDLGGVASALRVDTASLPLRHDGAFSWIGDYNAPVKNFVQGMLQTELGKVLNTNLLTLLPDGAGQVASCVINSAAAWSQLKLLDWGNPFAWQCPNYALSSNQMGFTQTSWPANDGSTCQDFSADTCLADSSTSNGTSLTLMQLRAYSLCCLHSDNGKRGILGSSRSTQRARGYLADNSKWKEYSLSCANINLPDSSWSQHAVTPAGGSGSSWHDPRYTVQLAEPMNALSNKAFDHLTCEATVPSWGKEAATMLGFGSFAFHAAGGGSFSGALDDVGMKLLISTMFATLAENTSGSSGASQMLMIEGQTYNMKTLARDGIVKMRNAFTNCCTQAASTSPEQVTRQVINSLPAYRTITALMIIGLTFYCYPAHPAGFPSMAIFKALGIENMGPLALFRLDSGCPNRAKCPKPLPADSHTNPNGVCYNFNRFLLNFLCAIFVQEQITISVLADRHDQWHQRVSLAARYGFRAFDAIKP